MNERIIELAEQAGFENGHQDRYGNSLSQELEQFAELIIGECKENIYKVWYEQGVDCRGAELGKFLTRFDEHFGVEE